MAIAIVAALAIREIFTALVITLFVLVAETLEGLTVGRGRTAIRHLVGLLPTTATVRRNESWQDVETKEIAVGEIVLVKSGARIPVDGIVAGVEGFSSSMQRYPSGRVCIVVLSNLSSYKPLELGDHIAADLFHQALPAVR